MKLDKNYNIKTEKGDIYIDSFDKLVDLIMEAKQTNKITNKEAKFLLRFAINRQHQKEIKEFINSAFANTEKTEKHTLFVQLKNTTTHYVSE